MELEKNERINDLLEFYSPLLTKKQQEYMQLYYGDDYSLGEIAENFQVSRQAVYDNIRRTEKILTGYEAKLHLALEFDLRNDKLDQLSAYVKKHYGDDQELQRLIGQLDHLEAE